MISESIFTAIVLILFAAQMFCPRIAARAAPLLFTGTVAASSVVALHAAAKQLHLWQADPVMKHVVPPLGSADYFAGYIGFRIFAPYAAALISAVTVMLIMYILNRRFGERFFESEEIPLAATAIFLIGWPGVVAYGVLILTILLLGALWVKGEGCRSEYRDREKVISLRLWKRVWSYVFSFRALKLKIKDQKLYLHPHPSLQNRVL
jgi:hypothetical protein